MAKKYRNAAMAAVHETADDLHRAGGIDKKAMLKFDALAAWEHYQSTGLHVTAQEADIWLKKLEAGKNASPPRCHT